MAVQNKTREEIRVLVGQGVDPTEFQLVVATTGGSTTACPTDDLFGSGSEWANRYWLGTGPTNNDGTLARITTSAESNSRITLTLYPAVTSVAAGDTAEIWRQKFNPRNIEALINEIIGSVHGEFYDPVEDITFHGGQGGSVARIGIPTTLDMIEGIFYRSSYLKKTVLSEGQVWDESVGAIFTVTHDNEHLLFNKVSTRFVVSGAGDGQIASMDITSLDLSGLDYIEFPIEVDIAVAAGDLLLRLSASVNGADTDKIITIPALTAGSQIWVRVAMTEAISSFTPKEATDIISVALEYDANSRANTIWLGEIEGTRNNGTVWTLIDQTEWEIDKEARDLVFKSPSREKSTGAERAGYALFKIKGGDTPISLDADATVSEVPEDFIVNEVIAQALVRFGDEDDAKRAAFFASKAAIARAAFPDTRYQRQVV